MKRALSLALSVFLLLGLLALPVSAAEEKTYSVEYMEADGFYRVTNPNGGTRLSVRDKNRIVEVKDGGYTYAFRDADGDGELDVYEDWRLDAVTRAADLADRLDIAEMSALMLYPFMGTPTGGELSEATMQLLEKGCRFVLSNSSDSVSDNVLWNNNMQAWLEENDPYGIPMNRAADPLNTTSNSALGIYNEGTVTVYNDTGVSGWPGNLGLAATFDPYYTLLHGQAASREYRALGIATALSPQVDLASEPRWTRFSGTFGEGSLLSADLAKAYIHGFQSGWDGLGADAEDLGWNSDSVICMIKHYPGDGAAESGREAHNNTGKYNVYPGNNLAEHVSVFAATIDIEGSKTGGLKAAMPSYSIAMTESGSIGEAVGSGYSSYKLRDILRDELGFEGLICCDWEITTGKIWGVEDLTIPERHLKAIEAGMNMFGGSAAADANEVAYQIGVLANTDVSTWSPASGLTEADGTDGTEYMTGLYRESAQKCLEISFYTGLFDDAYLCLAESEATVGCDEFRAAGFEAQLASVVMVKNAGGVISDNGGEKKTVYVPLKYTAASASGSASIGYQLGTEEMLSAAFNVVTDTIRDGADPESYTEDDIVRRTDFDGVDFALVSFSAPNYTGSGSVDYDNSDGSIDNGYYPTSLQFGEYYADPAFTDMPLGVDPDEELEWIAAGGEPGTSRYYGGKSVAGNTATPEMIAALRERVGELPIVAYVTASNPFCCYEFEENVDAILIGFSISNAAACQVIGGCYEPNGLLPCQLPANMQTVEEQYEDVSFDMQCHVDSEGNTYDYAFGMDWDGVITDSRTETYGRAAYADSPYASH